MGKQLAVRSSNTLSKAKDYKSELAKYAKEDGARLPSGSGSSISIRGKVFSFQGATLDEPLKVVCVDYAFENALYDAKYDPENPAPPVCFAVAKTQDELRPHENSPAPQADNCKECPHNQWGTAEQGRGKACKNNIRLALLSTNTKSFNADYVAKTDVASMRLPPTSVKNFRGYLKKITEGLQLPLFSVVTALSFEEDAATPVVVPQFEDEINDRKTLIALADKREDAQGPLLQPYDTSNYVEPDARKKGSGKKAAPAKPNKPVVRKSKF